MRTSLVGLSLLVAVLVSCQDGRAPTEPLDAGSPALAKSPNAGNLRFEFERLAGNDVTGASGAIRGVNAAGLPWRLDRGEARLTSADELEVKVEGLVLQTSGANPQANFRAILSCQTNGEENTLATVNLTSQQFAASPEGDATLRETLEGIPSPCYAPIVFVTNAAGTAWFAVSGF